MFNDLVYALTRTFRCSLVGITSPELAEVADVRIINSRGGLVLFFHFYLSLEMDNFIHSKACSTITVFLVQIASFEHPTVGEGEELAELDTVGKRSLFITGGEG